jgi:hypothetical protein
VTLRYPARMRPTLSLALLVVACTPNTGGDTGTTTGTTGDTGSPADTGSSGAVDPTTTDPDTDIPHPSEVGTTTDAGSTTTSDASTSTTGDPDTTGATTGAEFCKGYQGPDGAPFLDLYDKDGNLLTAGSLLPLECGGQGLFMFGLYPKFGGFVTPANDNIEVDLVVDVEGFNNNPEGHFYSAHPVGYYVACDDQIGGIYGVIPIFPLDNLDDIYALDGKPAQIHVIMPTDDEPLAVDLDVVLSVVEGDNWDFCGG